MTDIKENNLLTEEAPLPDEVKIAKCKLWNEQNKLLLGIVTLIGAVFVTVVTIGPQKQIGDMPLEGDWVYEVVFEDFHGIDDDSTTFRAHGEAILRWDPVYTRYKVFIWYYIVQEGRDDDVVNAKLSGDIRSEDTDGWPATRFRISIVITHRNTPVEDFEDLPSDRTTYEDAFVEKSADGEHAVRIEAKFAAGNSRGTVILTRP